MTITTPAVSQSYLRKSIDTSAKKEENQGLNPEIISSGAPKKDIEDQRIKHLYDKLMKSDYETSFDNKFKPKTESSQNDEKH